MLTKSQHSALKEILLEISGKDFADEEVELIGTSLIRSFGVLLAMKCQQMSSGGSGE